jgi:hypothetical protein
MELFNPSRYLQKELTVQNGNILYNQQFVQKQFISHVPEPFFTEHIFPHLTLELIFLVCF